MNQIEFHDERRDIARLDSKQAMIDFMVQHFISVANESIQNRGVFTVALSGGSTPNALYQALASPKYKTKIDWNKVILYWSDERAVPPDHPESNYHAAMQAGLGSLSIPAENIFRIKAEEHIEEHALEYETILNGKTLDLVMLGMGEDGHTASLFPHTHALHSGPRLVVANFIPAKECWRMTLTFKCINSAKNIAIYVMGENKTKMLERALSLPYTPDDIPVQRVGTEKNKALWITDIKKKEF